MYFKNVKVGKYMRDEEIRLLFQALGQILSNQDDIKKRLGLIEYNYEDEETMKISRKCLEIAYDFNSY